MELAINTLEYFTTVSEVRFEEGVLSAYVNCVFRVGYKNFDTSALIDTGNNFGSCVSEKFALSLGFSLNLLAPSPTKLVRQAGAGAILTVMGIGSLRVKNLSEKRRTLHDQFKLGHLCNIAPPLATPKVDTATCKERRSIIQAQVKINEEFQNEYLEDLYDLILEFAEVISWNDEPGRTTLGETFH